MEEKDIRVVQRVRNQSGEILAEAVKEARIENDMTMLADEMNLLRTDLENIDSNFSMSNVIKKRIAEFNNSTSDPFTFRCNDNISQFIDDEKELELLIEEVATRFQTVLESLVIDTENDHNTRDTAIRVAKMFILETFGGRYRAKPKVTSFPNVGYHGLYTTGPISIKSTCAHHFQNIVGKCWVGVVPEKEVIGLSKFNRIVHHIAERPQIQEEMTTQIAGELKEFTKSDNIAVVLKAEHHCMTHRGVKEHESDMVTTHLSGTFKVNDALRAEFYNLIQNLKSF